MPNVRKCLLEVARRKWRFFSAAFMLILPRTGRRRHHWIGTAREFHGVGAPGDEEGGGEK